MIKKWLEIISYEHNNLILPPTYITNYLFTHPPIYQLTYLLTQQLTYLPPIYLSIYLPTYPPTHPPINLLTHSLTYLPTYLPIPTTYLSSYNLLITYFIVLWWYETNMWNKKFDENWTPLML
jgi:hypothetical protein